MRGYIRIGVVAVIIGAACWFFGLAVVPSVVVVLVLAGLGITLRMIVPPTDNVEWPPAPPEAREGARREVSELTWAIRAPGGVVDDRIVERVRNIAATGLARRQLDLENPAHRVRIERLIGSPIYALLSSHEHRRVTLPAILSTLRVLEALEESDPAART